MTILEALRGSMKRLTDSKKALNTIGGYTHQTRREGGARRVSGFLGSDPRREWLV
jgi:hypothetical protein